jgi:hypothetical protein
MSDESLQMQALYFRKKLHDHLFAEGEAHDGVAGSGESIHRRTAIDGLGRAAAQA